MEAIEKETVASRIKELRLLMKMSQTKFGNAIGVASNYISAFEGGRRKPGMVLAKRIIKLADRYDIQIDESYLRPDLEE